MRLRRWFVPARSVWFVALAAPAVLVAAALGAGGQAQTPTFRSQVEVTQFDVTVLDRDRRPVRGLTAPDFTATIDGAPARVSAVVPVEVPAAPARTFAAWRRDVAPGIVTNAEEARRIVVIIIDDARTGANRTLVTGSGMGSSVGTFRDPWILGAGKRIANDVINGLGPNDVAAVVFTYLGRGQNFTSDRAKLLKAIDTYIPQDGTAAGPPLGCVFRGRLGCSLDTVEHVIDALPTTPPLRKVIVSISQSIGIPFSADSLVALDQRERNRDLPSADLSDAQWMFQKLQRSNATVYAFSPGGLQVVKGGGSESLRYFAEGTGGRAVVDTNAPWEGVPQMLEETSSYYLVGVETPKLDGLFHSVRISVGRPGVEVRTRSGYIAPRADGSVGRPVKRGAPVPPPLEFAMAQGFPKGDLSLMANALTRFVPGRKEGDVQLVVGVPTATARGGAWPLALRASAFDYKLYRLKASTAQTIEIDPASGSIAEVRARLRLPPGRYEVRVAGDASGRTGSVLLDVEFPELGKPPVWMSALGVTTALGDPRNAALTVRRTFPAAERPRLVLQVVQGGRAPLAPATEVATFVDERDETVATETIAVGASSFATGRMADVAVDLPIARLTAGEYLATVTANIGEHRATSELRFRRQ